MSEPQETGTDRCEEQVLGLRCERKEGHDGPCARDERREERRFGQ